ncbi:dihydrofolate reductase family protein [Metabacillus sp. Hm71]|uniref:dihydrofolate reductase family protein n=1 Tax=Metabacillus sp. Hm71 TaxID=3450743 RepID=UPI003F42E07E
MNISYIIAGEDELDKALVLHKLATLFHMEQIMIGGGGLLNWSFLQNGFVDEVSIVMAPIALMVILKHKACLQLQSHSQRFSHFRSHLLMCKN